jgi:hypothetical protein
VNTYCFHTIDDATDFCFRAMLREVKFQVYPIVSDNVLSVLISIDEIDNSLARDCKGTLCGFLPIELIERGYIQEDPLYFVKDIDIYKGNYIAIDLKSGSIAIVATHNIVRVIQITEREDLAMAERLAAKY